MQGYIVLAFWTSLRLQTVLPCRVLLLYVCTNRAIWLLKDPFQWFPSSMARSSAFSLAWQFRAHPTLAAPSPPLSLGLPCPQHKRTPTKSPVPLNKLMPSAWKSWPSSTSQLKCLLFWEVFPYLPKRSNSPSLGMPQYVWILTPVTHVVV